MPADLIRLLRNNYSIIKLNWLEHYGNGVKVMGWLPCVGQLTWTYSITTGPIPNADGLTNTYQWSKGHSTRICGQSSINPSLSRKNSSMPVLLSTCGLIVTFSQVKEYVSRLYNSTELQA